MAFSGTVGQTSFDLSRVIEHAMRQCKIAAQQITSEHIEIAKGQLSLMLSSWANDGPLLWCVEKVVLPIYEGRAAVSLPVGTIDVLNSNLRSLSIAAGTETTDATTHEVALSSAAAVAVVGVQWGVTGVPIVVERSDDGLVWTVEATDTSIAAEGSWVWYDLSEVTTTTFYRVRATSGTLTLTDIVLGTTPTEIPLSRLNRDDWTSLPNKSFGSNRPLQFWFDRQAVQPVMHLWPMPNADAETSQIVAWCTRHVMDVGDMTQDVEVPQRWLDALVSGLASRLVFELPEADISRQGALDQRAAQALYLAQSEERDNSPSYMAPDISMYTA